MGLLIGADLDRVANLRNEYRMGHRGASRQGRNQVARGRPHDPGMTKPAHPGTQQREQGLPGDAPEAQLIGRRLEHAQHLFGRRLVQQRIEARVQQVALHAIRRHGRRPAGVRRDPGRDLALQFRREFAIDQAMEVVVGEIHFTTFSARAGTAPPSSRAASRARPRDRRDITVPAGTPRVCATSS